MATDGDDDDCSGGGDGERPLSLLERHPLLGWCLTCAMLVGFGVFMVHAIGRAFYHTPEFRATVSAYEGLDDDPAGAATFRVALRVDNERNMRPFCAERGSVAVSYAGVPLARAALPRFRVPSWSVATVPIVATGDGTRGVPAGLHRRMEGQRQRRERVPLSVQVTMEKFTSYDAWSMLVWCRAMPDGQPVRPSLCPRFSVVDAKHRLDGWINRPVL